MPKQRTRPPSTRPAPATEAQNFAGLRIMICELESEALGRYVSEPRNLKKVYRILGSALSRLRELEPLGEVNRCPEGWTHKMCRCYPPGGAD